MVEAGFDGIEHASFLVNKAGKQVFVPEVADRVARAGIPCTTTLAVGEFMLRALEAMERRTPAEQATLDRWKFMGDDNLAQFGKMRDAGVTWVAGTDAGWRYTEIEGMPLEIELMHRGGMPALEAINAGTGLAAKVLGIADRVGTLQPGMIADVIAVAGYPLDDLARLGDVRLVLQGGEVRVQHPV